MLFEGTSGLPFLRDLLERLTFALITLLLLGMALELVTSALWSHIVISFKIHRHLFYEGVLRILKIGFALGDTTATCRNRRSVMLTLHVSDEIVAWDDRWDWSSWVNNQGHVLLLFLVRQIIVALGACLLLLWGHDTIFTRWKCHRTTQGLGFGVDNDRGAVVRLHIQASLYLAVWVCGHWRVCLRVRNAYSHAAPLISWRYRGRLQVRYYSAIIFRIIRVLSHISAPCRRGPRHACSWIQICRFLRLLNGRRTVHSLWDEAQVQTFVLLLLLRRPSTARRYLSIDANRCGSLLNRPHVHWFTTTN